MPGTGSYRLRFYLDEPLCSVFMLCKLGAISYNLVGVLLDGKNRDLY